MFSVLVASHSCATGLEPAVLRLGMLIPRVLMRHWGLAVLNSRDVYLLAMLVAPKHADQVINREEEHADERCQDDDENAVEEPFENFVGPPPDVRYRKQP